MADIEHDVFSFVAIRPPATGENERPREVLRDHRPLDETYVARTMGALGEGRSHDRLLRVLQQHAAEDGLNVALPDSPASAAVGVIGEVVRRAYAEDTVEGLAEAFRTSRWAGRGLPDEPVMIDPMVAGHGWSMGDLSANHVPCSCM